MPTKAQLAAEIRQNVALKSAPKPGLRAIEREAKILRKLTGLPKPVLEALHAEALHVSPDTQALAELAAQTLAGRGVIISISGDAVRVEQPFAEMGPERVTGFDQTVRLLSAAGFEFATGGCTCFLDAL